MKVRTSTHPGWLSNAYLVSAETSAVFVDSGAPLEPLLEAARRERLRVEAVLVTHRHGDHISGNDLLARETGAPILAGEPEAPFVPGASPLAWDSSLRLGELDVSVVPLAGHTAGHTGFLVRGVGLFTGDCLFRGSLGGTLGPAASGFDDLCASVRRILAFPDHTVVYPGHAEATTVAEERANNPFIRVLLGSDPPLDRPCRVAGRPARLQVLARDYDGGTKAWVRFPDGVDAIAPGSQVEVLD